MTKCLIESCTAMAVDGESFCAVHRRGIRTVATKVRCRRCRRSIEQGALAILAHDGWHHVACAPRSTRPPKPSMALLAKMEGGGD